GRTGSGRSRRVTPAPSKAGPFPAAARRRAGDASGQPQLGRHPQHAGRQVLELAREGTLFRDAVSQASWTKVSTPSLLTSLYPTTHGVTEFSGRLPSSAHTLAEVYREAGTAASASRPSAARRRLLWGSRPARVRHRDLHRHQLTGAGGTD